MPWYNPFRKKEKEPSVKDLRCPGCNETIYINPLLYNIDTKRMYHGYDCAEKDNSERSRLLFITRLEALDLLKKKGKS